MDRTQTGDNLLGYHYFGNFNSDNVDLGCLERIVGNKLGSAPILADAKCTLVCIYMSIILLVSSGIYELFAVAYMDSIGTLGLSYFAFKEGMECFEKTKSNKNCCCD
ncbi:hypothetical protein [Ulvibacterium sp.]|uniref:hypothetical protein n=1 Tax=Ulvibacterium sp. TaxID=2665914 RepID=UPI003BAA4981